MDAANSQSGEMDGPPSFGGVLDGQGGEGDSKAADRPVLKMEMETAVTHSQ